MLLEKCNELQRSKRRELELDQKRLGKDSGDSQILVMRLKEEGLKLEVCHEDQNVFCVL